MGIIHVLPKWIKRRPGKRRKSSGGARVERNRDGILYFRQPTGDDQFITWHVYPRGEDILRRQGVTEGTRLTPGLFKKLLNQGHLYTEGGKPSDGRFKGTSPKRPPSGREASSATTTGQRGTKATKNIPQAEATAKKKAQEAARREAGFASLVGRHKQKKREQDGRSPGSGHVIGVQKTHAESPPNPKSETRPMQRAFPPSWRGFGTAPQRRSQEGQGRNDSRRHGTQRDQDAPSAAARIHPGWLAPSSKTTADQAQSTARPAQNGEVDGAQSGDSWETRQGSTNQRDR